jgi:rsbT co-antagonist protein RsbR
MALMSSVLVNTSKNPKGNMVMIGPRACVIQYINHTIPGLSVDKVVGAKQLEFVEPQHREMVQATNEKVFSTGESFTFEIQGVGHEGEPAWYSSTTGPVRRDQEIVAVAVFTTDISDQKIAENELQKTKDALIAQQAQAIQELSTPVIKVWDGVLILPLIGTVDTARGQQITENLLKSIVTTQASVVIIDITGIPVVDTMVAGHFLNTFQSAKLLGAEVILTGVSPLIAQALVSLGVDLSAVTTKGSLEAGLKLAIERTGK